MEIYKSLLSPRWFYTERFNEIPEKYRTGLLQESGIDPARERILASGYIDQIFNRCGQFFLITRKRVVFRGGSGLSQTLIADLMGVERPFGCNISLLSPNRTSLMFHSSLVPPATLCTKVFTLISRLWIEHRVGASKQAGAFEADGKICPFCAETPQAATWTCRFSRDLPRYASDLGH